MDRIGATLARTTLRPLVTPRAVEGLGTRKVVVMDYLAGVPLSRSLQLMKVRSQKRLEHRFNVSQPVN